MTLDLKKLRKHIHAALKAWHDHEGLPEDLLSYLLLVKAEQRQNPAQPARWATTTVLNQGIEIVGKQNALLAQILTYRFVEGLTGRETAVCLNLSPDQVNRRQRQAIIDLTQVIWEQENALRQIQGEALTAELHPPTYSVLIGIDETQAQLVADLAAPRHPWLVAVVGVGGIGKTAVADAAVRRVIQQFRFEAIIWLQVGQPRSGWGPTMPDLTLDSLITELADRLLLFDVPPPQRLPRVRQALKAQPYLIIIDNLETETDTTYLLAHLRDLAHPSKFLLTSRTAPPPEMEVAVHPLQELTPEDTVNLLRHYGRISRTPQLVQAPDEALQTIYAVTGGNPLALKLVTGLISRHLPLPDILANLDRTVVGGEQLYLHIYAKTWQTLSQAAQTVLPLMLLVADSGTTLSHLQAMCALSEKELWTAVTELTARSLLEARGTITQPRYVIHRLTATYLRAQWGDTAVLDTAILANLSHWHSHIQANSLLNEDRHNLIQALQLGWQRPLTQDKALNLAHAAFLWVERRGYWREWIALLDNFLATWPPSLVASKGKTLNQLGHLYQRNRQLGEALKRHHQSERWAEQRGNAQGVALAQFQLSVDYYHSHQYGRAAELGQAALAYWQTHGEGVLRPQAAVCNQLGLTARASGALAVAQQQLTTAVSLWRQLDDTTELARSLHNLAIVSQEQGEIKAALKAYQEAQRLLEIEQHPADVASIALSLGTLYYGQEAWNQAYDAYKEAETAVVNNPAYIYLQALAASNLGWVLLAQERVDEAEAYFRQSIERWREADEAISWANALNGLGQVLLKQGDGKRASRCFQEALALLADWGHDPRADRVRNEILALLRDI